jgi:hypothetical protein
MVIDARPGDYIVVGDNDPPPVLAEVLKREPDGEPLLRLLPGRPDAHPEFHARRVSTAV